MPKHRKMCTTCCSKLLLFNFMRQKANNPMPRMSSKLGRHAHLEEAGPPLKRVTLPSEERTKNRSPRTTPQTHHQGQPPTHHQGRPQTITNQINYLRIKILAIPIDLGVIATATRHFSMKIHRYTI